MSARHPALLGLLAALWGSSYLLLGTLFVAAPFLLISFGELHVPSGLTAILIAPSPIFVALLALVLDPSERLAGRGWVASPWA